MKGAEGLSPWLWKSVALTAHLLTDQDSQGVACFGMWSVASLHWLLDLEFSLTCRSTHPSVDTGRALPASHWAGEHMALRKGPLVFEGT